MEHTEAEKTLRSLRNKLRKGFALLAAAVVVLAGHWVFVAFDCRDGCGGLNRALLITYPVVVVTLGAVAHRKRRSDM
jgi:hypothetical protein